MRKILAILLFINIIFMTGFVNAQENGIKTKAKKVGLALSGGGALGYAHIGFLQAMKEYKFDVDVVSGTSMGSIIGALYSAGYSPMEILELVDKENMNKFLNVVKLNSRFYKGFFNHEKLSNVLSRTIPHNDFSKLNKKFYCCVTDFNQATYKFVGEGNLLKEYVMASASIPIVYEPMEVEGEQYIDGGVMQNLPVEPLINEKCDLIIGVDVISLPKRKEIKGLGRIMSRTIALYIMGNTKIWADKCDYVIKPNLENYTILDFDKAQELFDIGYEAGKLFFQDYVKKNK